MKAELTNEFLHELICCPKVIQKAERKNMLQQNRSFRNSMNLKSVDGHYDYVMFLRQSAAFCEDFSVGLKWINAEKYFDIKKSIILLRCQGPHDIKQDTGTDCHHDYHVHEITVKDIMEKRYTRPTKKKIVKEFGSFETAIVYFCKLCGISGLNKWIDIDLPDIDQMSIFDMLGDNND